MTSLIKHTHDMLWQAGEGYLGEDLERAVYVDGPFLVLHVQQGHVQLLITLHGIHGVINNSCKCISLRYTEYMVSLTTVLNVLITLHGIHGVINNSSKCISLRYTEYMVSLTTVLNVLITLHGIHGVINNSSKCSHYATRNTWCH